MIEFLKYWFVDVPVKAFHLWWWDFVWPNFGWAAVISTASYVLMLLWQSWRGTPSGTLLQLRENPMANIQSFLISGAYIIGVIFLSFIVCMIFLAPQQIHSELSHDLGKAKKLLKGRENPGAFCIRPGETVSALMSPLIPDPNLRPASPDDLDFYFFSYMASASSDYVQFANITITNRSPKNMHLEIWGQIDYWKDDGETGRLGFKANWNPDGWDEQSGEEFIDLEPYQTKSGRIVLFPGKPEEHGVDEWFLEAGENIYLEVFDTVSGKRAAFKAIPGYPSGQIPSPLPSHKQLLALEFPAGAKAVSPDASNANELALVLRTRDLKFGRKSLGVSAMLKNKSSDRMELCVTLLGRSQAANSWLSLDGEWRRKGEAAESVLAIEPDKPMEAVLYFDLVRTGIDSANQQLSRSPKDTLLEIKDRISGKKIWCAIQPGYPPGTDMTALTILPLPHAESSPENPTANSGNSPKGAANDSQ